jgi:hypothetical protein
MELVGNTGAVDYLRQEQVQEQQQCLRMCAIQATAAPVNRFD